MNKRGTSVKTNSWFARLVIVLYLGAIVLANYLITRYGQVALPFVAFSLIPFDLIVRDLLQDRWQLEKTYVMRWRMAILIGSGGMISVWTNTGSLRINIASWLAFLVAGFIDALTYQRMIKYGRIFRINGATLTAAVTDSIIFVLIAFDSVNWKLVGLQIVMKVSGGFVWSLLLYRFFRTYKPIMVIDKFDLHEVSIMPDGKFEPGGIVQGYHTEWNPIETSIAPMPVDTGYEKSRDKRKDCPECMGTGSQVGYSDNLIMCVWCGGTGRK